MLKEKQVLKTLKDLKNIKVTQLENKNQFLISGNGFKCFQSYNSLVAIYLYEDQKLVLLKDWNYSNTTRKHLYIFINEYCYLPLIENELYYSKNKKKTILKLIENGSIIYDPSI